MELVFVTSLAQKEFIQGAIVLAKSVIHHVKCDLVCILPASMMEHAPTLSPFFAIRQAEGEHPEVESLALLQMYKRVVFVDPFIVFVRYPTFLHNTCPSVSFSYPDPSVWHPYGMVRNNQPVPLSKLVHASKHDTYLPGGPIWMVDRSTGMTYEGVKNFKPRSLDSDFISAGGMLFILYAMSLRLDFTGIGPENYSFPWCRSLTDVGYCYDKPWETKRSPFTKLWRYYKNLDVHQPGKN